MNEQKLLSALALGERMAQPDGAASWSPSLARRRLRRWKKTPPFHLEGMLDRRLASAGLDRRRFLYLLGQESATLPRGAASPRWLARLDQGLHSPPIAPQVELRFSRMEGAGRLCRAFAPWIDAGYRALVRGLEQVERRSDSPPWEPEVVAAGLLGALLGRITWIAGRALVLEMHVAGLEERLTGASPVERFESWLEQLARPEVLAEILENYPLLGRRVVEEVDRWRKSSLLVLEDLEQDWAEIAATIPGAAQAGTLESIDAGQGDLHEGGRSVAILRFAGGFRLVYKPRSLEVDRHFAVLAARVGEIAGMEITRPVALVPKAGHGWQEYVPHTPCQSPEQLEAYYRRLGGLLALLEILGATDLHHENLVADGPFPVPIDLETLFQPATPDPRFESEVDRRMAEDASRSVLRVGLLPDAAADAELGLDLSGIGAEEGREGRMLVPTWAEENTDAMHLEKRPARIGATAHRPRLGGSSPSPLSFASQLAAGFEKVYRAVHVARDELLEAGGLLDAFEKAEIRVLVRNTAVYELVLDRCYHPHALRHGLEWERVLDGLWTEVEFRPELEAFVAAERHDLMAGDIPVFRTRAGSRRLYAASGELPVPLSLSGLDRSRRRIAGLGEEDLERQLWLIRAAMTGLVQEDSDKGLDAVPPTRLGSGPEAGALAAALSLGRRLGAQAIRAGGRANWLGLIFSGLGRWTLSPLGAGLYDGIDGVVLFLAYLAEATGDSEMRGLADEALRTALEDPAADLRSLGVGAFDGRCSRLYLLTHLAALWQREDLADRARQIVRSLGDAVASDDAHDVISGAAGALVVLEGAWRRLGIDEAREQALACGRHLVDSARRMDGGLAWPARGDAAPRGMTGFSHGSAGIAWALAYLHRVTGETAFADAARDALVHERRLLDDDQHDGAVRRNAMGEVRAWCHGSPGVGLGRLGCFGLGDDQAVEADLRAAVKDTLSRGFTDVHCLCHGSLGNLEVVERTAEVLGDRALEEAARIRWQSLYEGLVTKGVVCGTPSGVETPALMTGLAGVGMALLRHAAPGVPSPLLLEPPA